MSTRATSRLGTQACVPESKFLAEVKPRPEAPERIEIKVAGNSHEPIGLPAQAGSKLGVWVDHVRPGGKPLPHQDDSFTSPRVDAKVWLEVKTSAGVVTSDPVNPHGWWGYGTEISVDVPKAASGDATLRTVLEFTDAAGQKVVERSNEATVDVLPPDSPIVRMTEDWKYEANCALKAGQPFRVAYDIDRLIQGMPVSNPSEERRSITAYVKFDDGYPVSLPVYDESSGSPRVVMPAVRIPEGTKSMQLWFEGMVTTATSKRTQVWDSGFGQNYTFAVEP